MENNKKTFGIVAITIYAALSGILFLPTGLIMLIAGQTPGFSGIFTTLMGILFIVFGTTLLVAMYGLWTFQEWGRKSMFWISAVAIPLGIVSIFPIWPGQQITTANIVLQMAGISIDVLIMYYLSGIQIQRSFAANKL